MLLLRQNANLNIFFMKKFYFLPILVLFALSGCKTSSVSVCEMTVELLENPIGVGAEQPRFSWQIVSETPDLMQTAYRIKVAADEAGLDQDENLVWDSGIVNSDQSVFVPYAGQKLESRKDYWWKVLVTTNKGDSVWSAPAHWSMALLDSADWKAQWIGIDSALNATDVVDDVRTRLAARYLRKEFPVDGTIASAKLYISGLGMYETAAHQTAARVGYRVHKGVIAGRQDGHTVAGGGQGADGPEHTGNDAGREAEPGALRRDERGGIGGHEAAGVIDVLVVHEQQRAIVKVLVREVPLEVARAVSLIGGVRGRVRLDRVFVPSVRFEGIVRGPACARAVYYSVLHLNFPLVARPGDERGATDRVREGERKQPEDHHCAGSLSGCSR